MVVYEMHCICDRCLTERVFTHPHRDTAFLSATLWARGHWCHPLRRWWNRWKAS